MGGGAVVSSGKGGRKALDASINLVPFIDLLSCCISFLLITAVWVNLGQLEAKSPASKSGEQEEPNHDVKLTLTVSEGGYVFQRSTGEEQTLPRLEGQLDEKGLTRLLADARTAFPKQQDMTVRSTDAVRYADLIRTLDLARGAAFDNVQVVPWQP